MNRLAVFDRYTGICWPQPLITTAAGASDYAELSESLAFKQRLGAVADRVNWLFADITQANLPPQRYDLWHDRAVFHFLSLPVQGAAYVQKFLYAVKPGSHLMMTHNRMVCRGRKSLYGFWKISSFAAILLANRS